MTARYRLLRAHRINRIMHPAGYEAELPTQLGDWLVGQGAAEPVAVPTPSIQSYRPARATPTAASAVPALLRPRQRACCGWGR